MNRILTRTAVRLAAVTVLLLGLGGCLAAAAAAGAGAAIAYNDRGVSTKVQGSVADVRQRTLAVFQEMGISVTAEDPDESGREHEVQGRHGDLEITVDIARENDALTAVDVYAQRSTVSWDRDFARDVLQRIIARS